jgi:hypothetical protein
LGRDLGRAHAREREERERERERLREIFRTVPLMWGPLHAIVILQQRVC